MRKGRFSEEQMVAIIREGDRDPVVARNCFFAISVRYLALPTKRRQ
jgi:hypothetical protein